jgi:hypothetical protein
VKPRELKGDQWRCTCEVRSHHSADCLSGHQRGNQEAINDTHLRGLISPLVQRNRKLPSPEALTMSVRGLGERREAPQRATHRGPRATRIGAHSAAGARRDGERA